MIDIDEKDIPEEYRKYFDHKHKHGETINEEDVLKTNYTYKQSSEAKKVALNRLSKAIGHLEHVKKLMNNDADTVEILQQLTAVRNALTSLGKVILKEHTMNCIEQAKRYDDEEAVEVITARSGYRPWGASESDVRQWPGVLENFRAKTWAKYCADG